VASRLARCRYGSEKITDIREAAEALLAGEIYDVEQKIYSDLHLEYELFEGVRDAALGLPGAVAKIQSVYMKAAILLDKGLAEEKGSGL